MINSKIQSQIIQLAKALLRFRTTADRPSELLACAAFISNFFEDADFTIRRFTKNDKPSLLITAKSTNKINILFHGHFDVVPAAAIAFTAKTKGGRLSGRGSLDMKSQVAGLMVLLKTLAKGTTNPLPALLLTGDEEVGGFDGTKYLMEKIKLRPQFVISAEPTWLKIGNTAKGIIRLKLTARGKSAHAAKPWEGVNAINILAKALGKLEQVFPTPPSPTPQTTVSATIIEGGDTINQVPARGEVQMDIRYAPTDAPEKIITRIRKLSPLVQTEVASLEPAAFCAADNKLVASLLNSIKKTTGKAGELFAKEAASDVRFFTAAGVPGVVFGPSGGGSHSENEWVDLNSLFIFYEILEDFVLANINLPKR